MEFRTFAQEIKGIYLWLVMPYIVLFSGNTLLRDVLKNRFEPTEPVNAIKILNGLRKIAVVLFAFAIFLISLFRGAMYVLTEEMVTEKVMPDGYIQGTWSGFLSESHYEYYEPVAGFLRKPMNWTAKQLTAKVQETYSPDAELVERQDGGWYVFCIPDALAKGEYIYFHVEDSYNASSNAFFQILLSEAIHFWDNKPREVTLANTAPLEDAVDTGEKLSAPFSIGKLYITCNGSSEDIAACAADLTDWLQFVKNANQLLYEENPKALSLLSNMCIGSGKDYFSFNLSPFDNYIGEDSWEVKYELMQSALTQAFAKHAAWLEEQASYRQEQEQAKDSMNQNSLDQEAMDAAFMSYYRGDYEKECPIGDGTVRYRMVIRDAALGSRAYSLIKSMDGGKTWQMSSSTPFGDSWGMGIDFTFLDENFGFATLMHNGGDEADLYVTENGGDTYQLVTMESYTVTLENGYTYNPYDYPQMPYEESGVIYVLCGQGADGDYAGGDAAGLALYQSADNGHTFTFVAIQKAD